MFEYLKTFQKSFIIGSIIGWLIGIVIIYFTLSIEVLRIISSTWFAPFIAYVLSNLFVMFVLSIIESRNK